MPSLVQPGVFFLAELNRSLTFTRNKRERERASEKEKWTVIMSWWVICLYPGQLWWKKRERQVTWEERRMLETLHAVRMSLLNTDDWVKRERPCANVSAHKSNYLQAYSFTRPFEPCSSAWAHCLWLINCSALLYKVLLINDNWTSLNLRRCIEQCCYW